MYVVATQLANLAMWWLDWKPVHVGLQDIDKTVWQDINCARSGKPVIDIRTLVALYYLYYNVYL